MLIIDDDVRVGRTLARVLRMHDVTVVASGDAALATLAAHRNFDVILCDLMMPGMSGVELSAVIAERHREMRARMVFVTGGASTRETEEFLDRPDVRWVAKPASSAEIIACLREVAAATSHHRGEPSSNHGVVVNVDV